MSYSLDSSPDLCYPETTVLINKFDVQDEQLLAEIEATIIWSKSDQWEKHPLINTFDFEHYKAIHAYLFSDIYEWAGQIRTVNFSKQGTQFCPYEEIETRAAAIFERLKQCNYFCGLSHDEFITELVDFYCSTNDLHPFREGNGRTQRLFLIQLVRHAGYELNFYEMDVDLLMFATIQAAHGVTNLLFDLFYEAIQ